MHNLQPVSAGASRLAYAAIFLASILIFTGLVWLIYFRGGETEYAVRLEFLPAVNATFNAASACCLVAGYGAIRARRIRLHAGLMLSAVTFSAAFLVCYVVYHEVHGDTPFGGSGIIRPVYFFVLISHVACTLFALPMILTTLFFAATRRFQQHRGIARITLPLWLYVSVTGVAIFFLLRAFS